uniref:Uncharacterized protein n=1 Tax=Oryza sativa subsp. japonica TaxID=39947 RepID=Q6H5M4_ORYSJ|nr:hypothetical protein [Oryza sativa Japonica Group]BAD25975.1 hypothetical protein [Oryza sativa Japonica Group]
MARLGRSPRLCGCGGGVGRKMRTEREELGCGGGVGRSLEATPSAAEKAGFDGAVAGDPERHRLSERICLQPQGSKIITTFYMRKQVPRSI